MEMSDLISRSELIKFFEEHMRTAEDFREIIINIIPTIKNQPTAYDIDKVVEELQRTMQDLNVIEVLSHIDFDSTIQNGLDNFLKAYNSELLRIVNQGKCAKEHKQLAEWLEELKAIKSDGFTDDLLNMGFTKGYHKALDDFVKFASTMSTVETEDGTIRPMWLEEMAEKLKKGKYNEQRNNNG